MAFKVLNTANFDNILPNIDDLQIISAQSWASWAWRSIGRVPYSGWVRTFTRPCCVKSGEGYEIILISFLSSRTEVFLLNIYIFRQIIQPVKMAFMVTLYTKHVICITIQTTLKINTLRNAHGFRRESGQKIRLYNIIPQFVGNRSVHNILGCNPL